MTKPPFATPELADAAADLLGAERALLRAGYSTKAEWKKKPANARLLRAFNRACRRFSAAQKKVK